MILWTIQKYEAWEHLKRVGELRGHSNFVDPDFLPAYSWMISQMKLRLGESDQNSFPIWAWYQWENSNKVKPDLRASGLLPRGTKGIRIEFEVEVVDVLLSDFTLWHYVLNNQYLPDSLDDEKEFYCALEKKELFNLKCGSNNSNLQKTIETSWNKIFNLAWFDSNEDIGFRKDNKSIQATLWKINLEQVRKVDVFMAR